MNSISGQNCDKPKYFLVIVALGLLLISAFISSPKIEVGTTAQNYYKVNGSEGIITGTVSFHSMPPQRKRIDMSQDSSCAAINPKAKAQDVMVANGMLANVLVFAKGGEVLEKYEFEPPSLPVVLDQQRCQFVPRVLGMQTGQTLKILNSDPTTHNIHPAPKNNAEWNQVQILGGTPIEKTFRHAEIFIPIKCNQHPWMKAFVSVFTHPFFAVTGKDGSFKIEGLPPGTYTLVARHEVFGEQTFEVTINPREAKNVSFTFNAKEQ
jgi:plastocyanin